MMVATNLNPEYKMELKWEETLNTHSCYPSSLIESRVTEIFKECSKFLRTWPWAPEIEAMFLRTRPTGSKPTRWNPDDKNQNWKRDINAETRELVVSLGKVEQGPVGLFAKTRKIWHWRELELCLSSPSCPQILIFKNRKSVRAVATLALENSSSLLRVCLPTEQ